LPGGILRPTRGHPGGTDEVEAVVRAAVAVLLAQAAGGAALAAAEPTAIALAAFPLAFAVVFVLPRAVASAPAVPLAFGGCLVILQLRQQSGERQSQDQAQQPTARSRATDSTRESIEGSLFHPDASPWHSTATAGQTDGSRYLFSLVNEAPGAY
jgi:hypothetical protein